jgi:hypothetical protein
MKLRRFEMSVLRRLGGVAMVAGLVAVGVAAMPHEANAWWRGGFGVGVWVPPVVVGPPVYPPPPVYAPPPVAYVAPPPAIIRHHVGYGCPHIGKALIGCKATGLDGSGGSRRDRSRLQEDISSHIVQSAWSTVADAWQGEGDGESASLIKPRLRRSQIDVVRLQA